MFWQGSGQVRGQPRSNQAGQPQGQGQQPLDPSTGPQATPAAQAAQGDDSTLAEDAAFDCISQPCMSMGKNQVVFCLLQLCNFA